MQLEAPLIEVKVDAQAVQVEAPGVAEYFPGEQLEQE